MNLSWFKNSVCGVNLNSKFVPVNERNKKEEKIFAWD